MEIKDTPIQRFKLIMTNEKRFYLVDVDTYKITWLFPTVTWYLKNNAIEITKEDYDQLKLEKKIINKKMTFIVSALPLGAILSKMIISVGEQNNLLLISGLIIVMLILFFLRMNQSINDYEHLKLLMKKGDYSFNSVIYLNIKENNEFKKTVIKGIVYILAFYIGFGILYFLIKSLLILLLVFTFPYVFMKANGLLKPDSDIKVLSER